MRLEFRSEGQANQYFKICRRILEENSRGPEGGRLGLQQIRNAIYRGFGFNNYSEFEGVFVPNERITAWFHSNNELNKAFSRAFEGAITVVHQRGFEITVATSKLIVLAVDHALQVNERALQRLIEAQTTSMDPKSSGERYI